MDTAHTPFRQGAGFSFARSRRTPGHRHAARTHSTVRRHPMERRTRPGPFRRVWREYTDRHAKTPNARKRPFTAFRRSGRHIVRPVRPAQAQRKGALNPATIRAPVRLSVRQSVQIASRHPLDGGNASVVSFQLFGRGNETPKPDATRKRVQHKRFPIL